MVEKQNPESLNVTLCELSLQACELKEILFDLACSMHALVTTLREKLPEFDETFNSNHEAVHKQLRGEAEALRATKESLDLLRQKYSCGFRVGTVSTDQQPVVTKTFRSNVFPTQR